LDWARRHGVSFEPTKYELIHFTRRPKKFDTKQKLRLGETTRNPKEAVGLHLDPNLKWKAHKKATLDKIATQTNALTRLTGSTWGLQLQALHHGPTMSYAAHAWHQSATSGGQGLESCKIFKINAYAP
jgi:hypothetical protein